MIIIFNKTNWISVSLLRLSIDPINNYQALTIILSLIHYFQT